MIVKDEMDGMSIVIFGGDRPLDPRLFVDPHPAFGVCISQNVANRRLLQLFMKNKRDQRPDIKRA